MMLNKYDVTNARELARQAHLGQLYGNGRNCKVIVDGDIRQKDVNGTYGLLDAINRLKNVPSVGIVNFTIDDCVRSGLVKHILRAYDK